MVLKVEDYNPEDDTFMIRRGISGGQEVDFTKTKQEHTQPCHPDFKPILKEIMKHRDYPFSPYMFTCKESRHKHKRFKKEIFNSRWNKAAKEIGVDIDLYHGTRHTTLSKYANKDKLTPEQLKILAGHESVETTMKYYTKVNIETERELLAGKVIPISAKKSANNPRTKKGSK